MDGISADMDHWLRGQFDEWLQDGEVKPGWMTRSWLAAQAAFYLEHDHALARRWVDQVCAERGTTFSAEPVIRSWLDEFLAQASSRRRPSVEQMANALVAATAISKRQATTEVLEWQSINKVPLSGDGHRGLMAVVASLAYILAISGAFDHIVGTELARWVVRSSVLGIWLLILNLQSRGTPEVLQLRGVPAHQPMDQFRLGLFYASLILALAIGVIGTAGRLQQWLILLSGWCFASTAIPLLLRIGRQRAAAFQIRSTMFRFDDDVRPALYSGWILVTTTLVTSFASAFFPHGTWFIGLFFSVVILFIFQAAHQLGFDQLESSGETALTRAAKLNDLCRIQQLLRGGANPHVKNAWRETPHELFARMTPPFDPNS